MLSRSLLALFLFLPAQSRAQQKLVGRDFRDFSSGLNDTIDATKIEPNQSPDAANVVIDDPPGTLGPRKGFILCGRTPSGSAATQLYEWFKSDGTRKLIVSDNGNIWETADCINFTTILSSLSSSARPRFTAARDKLWIVNGSTSVYVWNGTAATQLDGRTSTPNPAPPVCHFLEFWKERVWCGRTASFPSGVAFSALTDSAGNELDPSSGTASWPATNVVQIAQNMGGPIYAIRVFRDRLYVFKSNGIWFVDFNSEFDVSVIKTYSSVGTRFHEAIIEQDGFLYFLGPDGIYKFDGNNSIRISDQITTLFNSLNQPTINQLYKSWTSQGDFNGGTLNAISASEVSGSISLASSTLRDDFSDGNLTANPVWTNTSSNWTVSNGAAQNGVGSGRLYTTNIISTGAFQFDVRAYPTSGNNITVKFISNGTDFENSQGYGLKIEHTSGNTVDAKLIRYPGPTTLETNSGYSTTSGADNLNTYKVIRTTAGVFTVYEGSNLIITDTDTNYNTASNVIIDCGDGNCTADNIFFWSYVDSGTWTSDGHNAVSVSSWGVYDVTSIGNGGSLGYEVRLGTDAGGLAGASYAAINPGATINGTTSQVQVQTRITLTGSVGDKSVTPYLNDVTVNYSQGGAASQSIYGSSFKNNIWFTASSGASTTNGLAIVKSKYSDQVWMRHHIKISAMAKFNDLFYAAASTHSGIYRMEYGTNDDRAPIEWYWVTRDETWGVPYNQKYLQEIQADFIRGSAESVSLEWSSNRSSTWTARTIDMSGSGRGTTRQFINGGNGTAYRFRIRGAELDGTAQLLGLTGFSRVEEHRQ